MALTYIYKNAACLPRAVHREKQGKELLVYSPTTPAQIYKVMAVGSAWLATTPVHVGTLATVPAATNFPPYSLAVLTDQAFNYRSNGTATAWVQEGAAGGGSGITYVYDGTLASLPAATSYALGDLARTTGWPANKANLVWEVRLDSTGTKVWRPTAQVVVFDYAGSVATPLSTVNLAPLAAGSASAFSTPGSLTIPVGVMKTGRVFELDFAVRRTSGTTNDILLTGSVRLNGTPICGITFDSTNAAANGEYRGVFAVTGATVVTSSAQQMVTTSGARQNTVDVSIANLQSAAVTLDLAMNNGTASAVTGTYLLTRFRMTQLN